MWAAHDDTRDLTFVASMTDALERSPNAVLAMGDVIEVEDGKPRPRDFDFQTVGLSRAERMRRAAIMQCFHIYGLWRLEALRRIPLRDGDWWSDSPIMMAGCCLGDYIHVGGTHFMYKINLRAIWPRVAAFDGFKPLAPPCLPAAPGLRSVRAGMVGCCDREGRRRPLLGRLGWDLRRGKGDAPDCRPFRPPDRTAMGAVVQSLRKNLAANFLSRVWIGVLQIATLPYLLELLGPQGFGLVGVFLTLQSIAGIFEGALSLATNREIAQRRAADPSATKDILPMHAVAGLCCGIVLAAAVILLAPFLASYWISGDGCRSR